MNGLYKVVDELEEKQKEWLLIEIKKVEAQLLEQLNTFKEVLLSLLFEHETNHTIDIKNQCTDIKNQVISMIIDLEKRVEESTSVGMLSPVTGDMVSVPEVVNSTYEALRSIHSLTAGDYEGLGLTAGDYDAMGINAKRYDLVGYSIFNEHVCVGGSGGSGDGGVIPYGSPQMSYFVANTDAIQPILTIT